MHGINIALGRRILALRTARGFSQDKLAEKAEMSIRHLGKIERGAVNASIKCLEDIANALDISIRDILEVEHERSQEELLAALTIALPKLSFKDTQAVFRLVKALSER